MKIITLTSDMGHRDYYVGVLKGSIYKRVPDVNLVDISHEVSPFNILEASYHLRSSIADFPDETIHLIAVNSEPNININQPSSNDEWPMVMRYMNQYFVGIDNGIFSLILRDDVAQGFFRMTESMTRPDAARFPAKNLLARIAADIANGISLDSLGEQTDYCKKALALTPISDENVIVGHVVHIDRFGNLISNISQDLFRRVGRDFPFTIFFRNKNYFIDKICDNYHEVPHGERLAMFNSIGLLEIAINQGALGNGGGANTLFGVKVNDVVRIEFTPPGSKESLFEML